MVDAGDVLCQEVSTTRHDLISTLNYFLDFKIGITTVAKIFYGCIHTKSLSFFILILK